MPKFTKTLASLNTTQLLSAMGDFRIPVPAAYTVSQLRTLVKTHLAANLDLIHDPDYAPLFTKRVRDAYIAENPNPPSTPSSWHGIDPGSVDSRSSSPSVAPSLHESASPESPRDVEREARLQLFQSLNNKDLDRALPSLALAYFTSTPSSCLELELKALAYFISTPSSWLEPEPKALAYVTGTLTLCLELQLQDNLTSAREKEMWKKHYERILAMPNKDEIWRPRGNPNRLQITAPGVQAEFRCFVCGEIDPTHRTRRCNTRKLVTGKDVIVWSRKDGEPRLDRNGVSYCYSYNGRSGCDQGANCSHGKHWCTLCGSKDGSHAAQGCSAL
ncbi:hypothetical protein B0H13DRAFT_1862307 [Mycena leptocephala]|nr:hypothetical protein B0H13DRAFT_1862307 [Mycena leptocephala]